MEGRGVSTVLSLIVALPSRIVQICGVSIEENLIHEDVV